MTLRRQTAIAVLRTILVVISISLLLGLSVCGGASFTAAPARESVAVELATTEEEPGYLASPREVSPDIKNTAVAFVEAVGSWSGAESRSAVQRLHDLGYPPELTPVALPLMDIAADQARTTVIYPQYGGLTDTDASVIVVAAQQLTANEKVSTRQITHDIRLRREGDRWQVSARIEPPRPDPPAGSAGGATPLGAAVLGNPRIALPDTVRQDITSRRVGDQILTVMDRLGNQFNFTAQAAVSGHPGTIFPEARLSNHAVGRGVDIRQINGVRVIDIARDDPLLTEFMTAAKAAGATEVGGPLKLSGIEYFTDQVHQDHIHVAIDGPM